MKVYDFNASLRRGKESERWLAGLIREQGGRVLPGQGYVDLIAIIEGRRLTLDVKCDEVAERTGNLAIEVMSVEEHGKPGWAAHLPTDYIVSHLPDT